MKKAILFTSFILLTLAGCMEFDQPIAKASPILRILLGVDTKMVIKPNHNYMVSFDEKKEIGSGNIYISATTNGLMVNGVLVSGTEVEIDPSGFFQYENKTYRGQCKIIQVNNQLRLINLIELEPYLYSVVPSEMPNNWEIEALKAQAIVARTYALYEMVSARKKNQDFDLYPDTRSQVYKGVDSEDKYTTAAVDQTMGQVIKYQDRIIQSFFHSCSGGMTESSQYVWGGSEIPYLVSVPSPYGKIQNQYKWEISVPLNTIQNKLGLVQPISSINVISRSESQRILEVAVTDLSSNKTIVLGKDLRSLIGSTLMKSTRANLSVSNQTLFVQGVGYGHGVGLGQWDAQGMALEGFHYDKIILYFYRGTRIEKLW